MKLKHLINKTSVGLSAFFFSAAAFAVTPDPAHIQLATLQSNVANTSNSILKIIMTVITIAGIILVIKGIVHLKQNYTGSGQEKHLSKGLACLGFGAALFIAVPITHALVSAVSGDTAGTTFDQWNSDYAAGSLSS